MSDTAWMIVGDLSAGYLGWRLAHWHTAWRFRRQYAEILRRIDEEDA